MDRNYLLAPGIHVARVGGSWVFLDAVQDRYACVSDQQSDWFSELVFVRQHTELSANAIAFAERLCSRGLLTTEASEGSPIEECPIQDLRTANLARSEEPKASVRARRLGYFIADFIRYRHREQPRGRNLALMLSDVKAWKLQTKNLGRPNPEEVVSLARTFHSLTPWFFTQQDRCLFHSFLMMRYLTRFGVEPVWTFAVRLSPFRAHCWVSHGGMLLNEDLDVVSNYQPIMLV